MVENKMTEKITDKKVEDYRGDLNNFVGEKELLVTITLNEYRELVSEVAKKKKDIEEARDLKYKAQNELKEVKKQLEELQIKYADSILVCNLMKGENSHA